MPLDDALQMLSRDFGAYLNKLRAGAEQPALSFLLHLLADGKSMSEAEIERIIHHLKQRSDRERDSNGKDMPASDHSSTVAPMAGECRITLARVSINIQLVYIVVLGCDINYLPILFHCSFI
jgi:hypothetical protein